MTSPTLTWDRDANALYIRFSKARIVETVELSDSVYVDLDEDGEPVGFEVLHAEPDVLAGIPTLPDTAALRDLMKPEAARLADPGPVSALFTHRLWRRRDGREPSRPHAGPATPLVQVLPSPAGHPDSV